MPWICPGIFFCSNSFCKHFFQSLIFKYRKIVLIIIYFHYHSMTIRIIQRISHNFIIRSCMENTQVCHSIFCFYKWVMTRSKDSCCIMDLVMQSNILDDIPTRLLSLTAESSLSRIHTQHSLPVAENQVTLAVRLPSVMRSLSGASSVKKSALLNCSESDIFLMNCYTDLSWWKDGRLFIAYLETC